MKPKIVFFFSKLATGGAERQTAQLAKQLLHKGYGCELLTYYTQYSAEIVDEEIEAHVKFVCGRSMRDVFEWRKAWKALAALSPDIVVAVNQAILPIALMGRARGLFSCPIICTYHTTVLPNRKMKMLFPLARVSFRFTDMLVYVCDAQRHYWETRGLQARDSIVIHNGIDVSHYSEDRVPESRADAKATLGFSSNDLVIGLTAAFRPEKNHAQAVAALEKLRMSRVPAKLVFVGDGEMRSDIADLVSDRGLDEHVRFVGNQRDVRPFQKAMDIGILCSVSGETFSMAALEAMAMNVPMVMSRISGCVEMVVGDRGGRLFDVGNTDQLVARLIELSDSAVRARAAREAREIVVERYTEELMARKYIALFDRVAKKGRLETPKVGMADVASR